MEDDINTRGSRMQLEKGHFSRHSATETTPVQLAPNDQVSFHLIYPASQHLVGQPFRVVPKAPRL
jgi:hypothetical protein